MVSRVSLLMLLAICLSLDVVLEQPGSSLMFRHPRVEQIVALSACGGLRRTLRLVATFMGSFGAPTAKLTMLLGTPPWLQSLKRSFRFKQGAKKKGHDIVKRRIDKRGDLVFTGSKVGPWPHPQETTNRACIFRAARAVNWKNTNGVEELASSTGVEFGSPSNVGIFSIERYWSAMGR
jgi:hypothetical protein